MNAALEIISLCLQRIMNFFVSLWAKMEYSIQVKGRLLDLAQPQVMGILNATPDSFFAGSRCQTEQDVAQRVRQIISEGAAMIDVGACSTRPGSEPVSEAEEMERLRRALSVIRSEQPDAVVSVDTFRPDVARMAVEEYGADIINDVRPGKAMFRMVSRLRVPYIIISSQPTMRQILLTFAEQVQQLRDLGQKDIILDPGFGFGKTLEQNYDVLRDLTQLHALELPILVGVSRKSMIYKLLDTTPAEALNGTTVLNTMALQKGASILRVHDVRAAAECIALTEKV